MALDRIHTLRNIELFKDLTPEELERVNAIADERNYARGDYVFMEGQQHEAVYFIRRGLIKIFKVDEEGREHIVSILGGGQMFPHVGFFQDGAYPGTAEAIDTSSLLAIRRTKFDALLSEYPDITRKVMRVMGEKILQLQAKLRELALFDSHERVIALLKHFAEEHGVEKADGIHLSLPLTHGEMAHMIGMTRESVNRILNQLRRDGVVTGDREDWILHFDRLQKR